MIGLGLGSCQADLPSNLMYRFWHAPIVGLTVSHIWSSFATCLFMEFGHLTPGETYTDRSGEVRQRQPEGEWSITSMERWPAWWLRQNGRVIASFEECRPLRSHALRLLVGRRLNALEIDQASKSTRLTFSLGLQLETKTVIQRLHDKAHWMTRGPQQGIGGWSDVALRPWREVAR
jgi:hypothetical protein